MNPPAYSRDHYIIQRALFTVLHSKFRVFDPDGALVMCVIQKAFRLREDVRVYADEKQTQPVLILRARQIIDFAATYDMIDPATQQRLGALRRKGLRSMLRDQWEFLNYDDQPIGTIEEDSWWMSFVRRFLFNLLPQRYHADINGRRVAHFIRHVSLLRSKFTVRIEPGSSGVVDSRVLLAAGILLSAIEGKQD